MRSNNCIHERKWVDPYELIGEAKVDGIAPIKRIQDKAEQETETQGLLKL